ncbi:hypothetical protein D3C80_1900250 [compost metagenome]
MCRIRGVRRRFADHHVIDMCRGFADVKLRAFAGDFFIGDENRHQRAAPVIPVGGEPAHGFDHGDQRAFGIAGTAAI